MTNLFSAFEPTTLWSTNLNWMSSLIVLILIPSTMFMTPSSPKTMMKTITMAIHKEFSAILGPTTSAPASTWFLLSLMIFIFFNNFMGLFPYIFTSSSHVSFTLGLALPSWVGFTLFAWFKQPQAQLAHLVPNGTPALLMSFMVIIELVSNVIRPLTLSIRLMANLTAGHLLLCLLSSTMTTTLFSATSIVTMSALVMLIMLEIAVSIIQAYVFTLLTTLYLEEVQSKNLFKLSFKLKKLLAFKASIGTPNLNLILSP